MNRNYVIFNINEIDKINFNEVLETSTDTLRKSVDGTLTFVKYEGNTIPNSINLLDSKQGPFSHAEILNILDTNIWNDPNKEVLK